ncbi:MAG: glutamine-hydrolyzing carbamoyl-phosphate synthase small subunit [Candidatus Omnitrophica bacterium]|nr:glutamine-hydrolyzing carbamoyl-phosphate synthase small subunit [Candidatus Omnitrophota bacterium]
MKAVLMLEDGTSFNGEGFGSEKEVIGEVILNTAVVGYQEMMTDPANAGKILVPTYPLIGNYGISPKFNESSRCWISGLAIKEKSRMYSNWQAKSGLDAFVKEQGVAGINGVDTRTLAVHLRNNGEMLGVISTSNRGSKELLSKIEAFRKSQARDFIKKISVDKPTLIGSKKAKYKIAGLDLGITNSIIRQLEILGIVLNLLPYNTKPDEIMKIKPHGLIISSGPEEDVSLEEVAENTKSLIGRLPILGICTGHQVLASALGAKLQKMKLGHRGVNYPVAQPGSYKAEITTQNHGYVVEKNSLSKIKDVAMTGYHLNDKTVEEMESKKFKLLGVQYYPVSPGFNEVNGVFKKFIKLLN